MSGDTAASRWITLGRVSGLYGVRGWVKVFSETQPREGILGYQPLYLSRDGKEWQPYQVEQGRVQGKGVILKLRGCEDRDQAATLLGQSIAVTREQLPPAAPGEYYWADLIGLRVVTVAEIELGRVDSLFETGANDVVVVKDGEREHLLPFLQGSVVRSVDLEQGVMRVEWDPDF
ncbi:MAG TPA: ribosome maturation factor RimM [Candidatus Competibacteraceae bacterium]|nr:ribosome maturation factor RimM [Candidatus Competibacteraceae bacterium]